MGLDGLPGVYFSQVAVETTSAFDVGDGPREEGGIDGRPFPVDPWTKGERMRQPMAPDPTPSIRDLLRAGQTRLAQAGSPTPRLDAEVLLAGLLGTDRAGLYARLTDPVPPEVVDRYEVLLARRARGEPVAYLTGEKEFYGRPFRVDRRVLIPRPETELLVERALAFLAERPEARGVDAGTGSGCLAVTLALEAPRSRWIALDRSWGALEVARANARRHGVEDRIAFLLSDWLTALGGPVDLIVANPPYTRLKDVDPAVRAFEPRPALDGGPEGLDAYRTLLPQAARILAPGGRLLLEVGAGQAGAVADLVRRHLPRARIELHRDLAGIERVVEAEPGGASPLTVR